MPSFPTPYVGQHVRLRTNNGFDEIVTVVAVDEDDGVFLGVVLSAEEAHLLYASRSSAVHLTGRLEAVQDASSRLVVADSETFQRRDGFRAPMGVPATVVRMTGSEVACSVADLSAGGALLSPDAEELMLGERVQLRIDVAGLREVLLPAEVIRRDGARRGVRFEGLDAKADTLLSRAIFAAQRRRPE